MIVGSGNFRDRACRLGETARGLALQGVGGVPVDSHGPAISSITGAPVRSQR